MNVKEIDEMIEKAYEEEFEMQDMYDEEIINQFFKEA